jgi:uncharacterized Tic20 family protein
MPKAKPTAAAATAAEPAYAAPEETGDAMAGEKGKAILTHALGLLTFFVGPLVLYFAFRNRASPWLRAHLDESVNYRILETAALVLLVVGLALLPAAVTWLAIVMLAVLVVHAVFGLMAIVQSARGRPYHFPLDVRIVK